MTLTATVNYHVYKPFRQAFELDAGGVVGNLISPELAPTTVPLLDTRTSGDIPLFASDSVGFAAAPTAVATFDKPELWQTTYDAELTTLLAQVVGAKDVVVFDHTVRVDGHYAFIDVWRRVGAPINSAPLGFVLPDSVAEDDWLLLDLTYPDRKGQIMGLGANPKHRWVYQSSMTPDEVAYFNIYDNRGRPSIAHSALDRVEDPTVTTIRKSIESRTLVRL